MSEVLKFKVRVTTEREFNIVLPAKYLEPDIIASWERGLWNLGEDKVAEIVDYVARMAAYAPDGDHDGIGRIHTSPHLKPNREENPYVVEAYEDYEDTEVEILERKDV